MSLTAGERLILQLRDMKEKELKSGGFVLTEPARIHIQAKGACYENERMYAFGWIINADTRKDVWRMKCENTRSDGKDRSFNGDINLAAGSYEVYFTAYAYGSKSTFSSFFLNVDPRSHSLWGKSKKGGVVSWLDDLFGEDFDKDWSKRAPTWGIDVYAADESPTIRTFTAPKAFSNLFWKTPSAGENENITRAFSVAKSADLRIYAVGEQTSGDDPVDMAWIIEAKTRKRIWDMRDARVTHAGGAEKNIIFDGTITLRPGSYILHYMTDDSHSMVDWNAEPPRDPLNYGVSLIARSPEEKALLSLTTIDENKNIIVQIGKMRNDESRTENFTLKRDATVRVYAIGERGSRREMADYGWIINSRTREKVWTMDVDRTEFAGGTDKNRLIDEVISLPKGSYTVGYQSDDSHSYGDWNDSPPYDPLHWGITVYGEGDAFDPSIVERTGTNGDASIIAQLVRVGDDQKKSTRFSLSKPTKVRIYAIGEGENREMVDYGWIENTSNRNVVWEMTYSMTFHAGGARKNRMVNTTLLLDKGDYTLQYVTDDSHAYGDWNSEHPDDPTMWGITIYREE